MKQLLSILLLTLMASTAMAQELCDVIEETLSFVRQEVNNGRIQGALRALRVAQGMPELQNCPDYSLLADEIRRIESQQSSSSSGTSSSFGQNIVVTVNGVTFIMVAVKGGSFQMGATAEQGSDADSFEKPVHRVTLSDYYIGETEVTQALWQAVMGTNPSNWKGSNLPVEMVSWNDCQTFITKLNQLTGRRFRLPTEAEWEFAARGGNKSRGYKYSGSNTLSSVAWYGDNSDSKTHPVKQKSPNELGIYDMSGNVEEWCQDWIDSYSSSSQMNPQGPSSFTNRVCRGGSWDANAKWCRVSCRNCNGDPGDPGDFLGFRLAL